MSTCIVQKVGEDLPFFDGVQETTQVGCHIKDMSEASTAEVGQYLSQFNIDETIADAFVLAEASISNIEAAAPEYLQILNANASARGVTTIELVAALMTPDLIVNNTLKDMKKAMSPKGCTSMAFNNGLVGQTHDFDISYLGDHTTVLKTKDALHLVVDGMLFQAMGHHVGIVLNFLGAFAGEGFGPDDKILNMDAIFFAASRKNSVAEVIALLEEYRPAMPMNFTVADNQGDCAAIQVSKAGLNVIRNERGVAYTNHTEETRTALLAEMSYAEANKELSWTFAREDAANLFIAYTPEMTVEAMQYAFNQRPINMCKYDGNGFVTIEAMVFDVMAGCAYVSGDNPRFGNYTKVSLEN